MTPEEAWAVLDLQRPHSSDPVRLLDWLRAKARIKEEIEAAANPFQCEDCAKAEVEWNHQI